jgi:hypothetical protein
MLQDLVSVKCLHDTNALLFQLGTVTFHAKGVGIKENTHLMKLSSSMHAAKA